MAIQEPSPIVDTQKLQSTGLAQLEQKPSSSAQKKPKIIGKIQRFAENVDTDAIIPAEFMPGIDNADLGSHCFQYYSPEFLSKVAAGSTVIVAEGGFGSGSSREDAVRALLGAGVEAVIAKSFAFIYERNQLNMGLFNAILLADDFYEHAQEGGGITIDRNSRTIALDGIAETFSYTHTVVEETLLDAGGILPLYARYGRQLFREITSNKSQKASESAVARGLFEESRTRETLVVISSTS